MNGATIDIQPQFFTSLPTLDLTPSADDVSLAPTASITPEVSADVLPGAITDEVLGSKAYPPKDEDKDLFAEDSSARDGLTVSIQGVHMEVHKCGGPVAIRYHVQATMTTATSYDVVEMYSDILSL